MNKQVGNAVRCPICKQAFAVCTGISEFCQHGCNLTKLFFIKEFVILAYAYTQTLREKQIHLGDISECQRTYQHPQRQIAVFCFGVIYIRIICFVTYIVVIK